VFGRVNSESFDSNVDHFIGVIRNFLPDVILALVQIRHSQQGAVSDAPRVAVVDVAVVVVEVQRAEGNAGVALK